MDASQEQKKVAGEMPAEHVVGLFRIFWRWLLALGAVIVGLNTVLGVAIGWAIYSSATQEASNRAREAVDQRIPGLTEEIGRLREESYDALKKLYDARANGTADEQIARAAADSAKADAAKISEQVALVNAAAKSGPSLTTDQIQSAANTALAGYVATPSFRTSIVASVIDALNAKLKDIESAAAPPQITLEENIDRPGNPHDETRYSGIADPQACEQACLKDDKCLAYTFVPKNAQSGLLPGQPNPLCFLKRSQPIPVFAPGLTSGVRRLEGSRS